MDRNIRLAVLTLLSVFVVLVGAGERRQTTAAQNSEVCITDDDGGASLRFHSIEGDYTFCAGGRTFTGKGAVAKVGKVVTIQHQTSDRRLIASVNTGAKTGSGSIQSPVGTTIGAISDRNTADSSCACR